MEKLIITVALTGNAATKQMNPNLPVTADEIAADVHRCADAGAVLFHVHARDAHYKPTSDIAVYQEIVGRIKATAPKVIIQLNTGVRGAKDWKQRVDPIKLLPEMASFTTGSNNLPGRIYKNSPRFIEYLARIFKETGVKPEIEIFEAGMINNAVNLQKNRLLNAPLHFGFVLGVPGSMPATIKNLLFLSESIPAGSTWSVAGVGKAEIPLATAAVVMGGNVRVGLEDNLYLPDNTLASNPKLVEKVVAIAKEVGREIANPQEARAILSLDPQLKDRTRI